MESLFDHAFKLAKSLPAGRRFVLALVTIGVAATCALLVEAAVAAPAPAVSFIRSAGPIDAKRTIIVVNGGPGVDSQFTFRGFRGLVSTSRRVIAYDQRGVGRTPMPHSGLTINVDYSLDAFVADHDRDRALLPVYVGNPDRAVAIGKALGTSLCDDLVGAIANDSIIRDPRRRQLESALAHYHGPALIAIGALDPFGAEWANDDARPLRQAQVTKEILPRAGHFLWLESPTFLPLLRTFINRT